MRTTVKIISRRKKGNSASKSQQRTIKKHKEKAKSKGSYFIEKKKKSLPLHQKQKITQKFKILSEKANKKK
jgi:hypothetical protein